MTQPFPTGFTYFDENEYFKGISRASCKLMSNSLLYWDENDYLLSLDLSNALIQELKSGLEPFKIKAGDPFRILSMRSLPNSSIEGFS